jgi:flagellin
MDGALSEMSSMVIRVRELAIQSASDTYSNQERSMMNLEARQLLTEIHRSSESSKYQDHHTLRGDNKKLDIQVDANHGSANRISLNLEEFSQNPTALGINDVSLDTKHHAQLSLVKLDYAQGEISKSRAKIGAFMSRLGSTSNKLEMDAQTGKTSYSKIKDTDYANQTAKNVKDKIVQSAQVMVQAQINNSSSNALKLIG